MRITIGYASAIWPNKEYIIKNNVIYGFTIIGLLFTKSKNYYKLS